MGSRWLELMSCFGGGAVVADVKAAVGDGLIVMCLITSLRTRMRVMT